MRYLLLILFLQLSGFHPGLNVAWGNENPTISVSETIDSYADCIIFSYFIYDDLDSEQFSFCAGIPVAMFMRGNSRFYCVVTEVVTVVLAANRLISFLIDLPPPFLS